MMDPDARDGADKTAADAASARADARRRPDPAPTPPPEPDPEDCCGEGCVRCIYDVYDEKRERYRAALAAWRQRHPDGGAEDT